ncbi:MAG: hypothetical protein JRF07_00295 [Deltaproteobacteria bacterium]|jgi:hypothetical protein|nr:hypothetical protein [Deltaproteobacteria bacterium]
MNCPRQEAQFLHGLACGNTLTQQIGCEFVKELPDQHIPFLSPVDRTAPSDKILCDVGNQADKGSNTSNN